MTVAEIVHGTADGYRAGCKTDAMCDASAPWSCLAGYQRSRGDYAFNMRLKQGMTPTQIHELEQQEEAAWAEQQKAARKAAKPVADAPADVEDVTPTTPAPPTPTHEPRHPYGSAPGLGIAARAAAKRLASVPTPHDEPTSTVALAASTKEHPMPNTPKPEGAVLEWADPPSEVLERRTGRRGTYEWHIEQMRAKPRQWACLGEQAGGAETRWRTGKVAGTTKGEFEAVLDTRGRDNNRGVLYVRFVGKASS